MGALVHVNCNLCGKSGDDIPALFEKEGFSVVSCPDCDLCFVNPRLEQSELWNRYGEEYFREQYLPAYASVDIQARYRSVINRLRPYRKTGHLLDVGCGVGFFLSEAKRDGWSAQGTEIAEYAARYGRENLGLDILVGDLTELKFPREHFDVVTMWETIEHLQDPLAYLIEINRILRIGGLVALSTVNLDSLSYLMLRDRWWVIGPSDHIFYFTPHTLTRMLQKSGFTIIEMTSQDLDIRNIQDNLSSGLAKWLFASLGRRIQLIAPRFKRGDILLAYARKVRETVAPT